MNISLDEDDLQQMGLGADLLGSDGSAAPASGLGAALSQLTLMTPQVPSFPPPLDSDIPGGAALFSKALGGLAVPQYADASAPDQSTGDAGIASADPAATSNTATAPASIAPGSAGIPQASKMQNLDLSKATTYLDAHTSEDKDGKPKSPGTSGGECASYVRQALAAGGVNLPIINAAKDYGPALLKAGFTQLDAGARKTYTPQQGDVIIYQPFLPKHPYGHMEMYDGKHWVSDFMQQGPIPFGDGSLPYDVYRP